MTFSKFDKKMFAAARKIAKTSDFDTFHIGCVIVYKKHIIGMAANSKKTHPMQAEYNKYRNFNKTINGVKHSVHAEIAAINSIPYTIGKEVTDWSKVKVYTYRICKGRESGKGMSRPCPACLNALRDLGIRDIYYSTDDGYAYERIEKKWNAEDNYETSYLY